MRPEMQKQQTAANSRIKTSAAEGVLKDLRDLCEGNRVFSEVKIFQDWRFVVGFACVKHTRPIIQQIYAWLC